MASAPSFAKVWFVLSFAALSFGYGFASHAWDLFPKQYLERAWKQFSKESHRGLGPRTYDRKGARTLKPDEVQPGLTFVTASWYQSGEWKNGLRLIDREGHVVHKWSIDPEGLFSGENTYMRDPTRTDIHGAHLLSNGGVVFNFTYVGTVRLNSCGEIVWALSNGGHHSVSRSHDGTFWISAVSTEKKTRSERFPNGFPGLDRPVWVDQLVNVSPDGEVLSKISVLDLLYENDLARFILKNGRGMPDVTHLNDVEALPPSLADEYPLFEAGDLVVSLHHIDLVFVVDPDTRNVKWYTDEPFMGQHDPDFLGEGWVGIFDNNNDGKGGSVLGGSRVVGVQPHTDSSKIIFSPDSLDRFYTPVRGKWQMLKNGNMLLTESEAGRVAEVDHNGLLVWEWIHPGHNATVPSVTNGSRVDLSRADVKQWPCSSSASRKN